jgi:MFS family permease
LAASGTRTAAWAPLARPAFRTLWLAQLGSNVGTWMQTVGAQWILVRQPHAATLTSAAQAASLLPVLFISLPAGVLADVLDRRRLLAAITAAMAAGSGTLTALSVLGLATPATLITMTFLLGCLQALMGPSWQAIQPELVPREELPAAAALNSMNVNIARAIGPALAGLILALTSSSVVFGINSVSFLGVLTAVLAWRRRASSDGTSEPMLPALHAGLRYVRNAPGVRRVLLRATLFVLPASALWGLLPVVASHRLQLSSAGYGLLLGALGVGSVTGALLLRPLRARFGSNQLLAGSAAGYAAGVLACALLRSWVPVALLLLLAGLGWLVSLSTLNTTFQLALPAWVRARALAVYLMVFMGGQGIGALLWGLVAGGIGTPATLTAASVLLLAGVATLPWLPIHTKTGTLDRSVAAPFAEPALGTDPDPSAGPVLVEVSYRVAPENEAAFREAMDALGVSRRRTGATQWDLFRDAADPTSYVETFLVPSWGEHMRQHHDRTTGYDAELFTAATRLADGQPAARHLLPPGPPARGDAGHGG